MGLAERADLIVDFTNVPVGNYVLGNVGPDEPFGGAAGFEPPTRTRPVRSCSSASCPRSGSTHDAGPVPPAARDRAASGGDGHTAAGAAGGDVGIPRRSPAEALLGTVDGDPNLAPGVWVAKMWDGAGEREPGARRDRALGALQRHRRRPPDAHPRGHVRGCEPRRTSTWTRTTGRWRSCRLDPQPPEPWETGFKDTVIAYPEQVTRVRAQFNTPGQFVWHCHIVEHEDNEMMRPYRIGPVQAGQPE